ncbi:MAG: hypothetical protein RMJ17_00575, partial [Candidatus Aenigmarchaeota archaeon]|nr:hypothetical protein [Candidatus Aenigmarchaeota archaeon]MDW8149082.1 hypothetical protein [Candidatus Aenigmarchaeota archaeon]
KWLYDKKFDSYTYFFSFRVSNILEYLGGGFKQLAKNCSSNRQECINIFASFDFTPLIDKINKFKRKFYTEKFLRKQILPSFSQSIQEEALFLYYREASQAFLDVMKLLFASRPNDNDKLWENLDLMLSSVQRLKELEEMKLSGRPYYNKWGNPKVTLEDEYRWKLENLISLFSPVFKDPSYNFVYLLETWKIKDIIDVLEWNLYISREFKNVLEGRIGTQIFNTITERIKKWYDFFSNLKGFEEVTYSEYIAEVNDQEELFFRKKWVSALSSLFFVELFEIWIYFVKSVFANSWIPLISRKLWKIVRKWSNFDEKKSLMIMLLSLCRQLERLKFMFSSSFFWGKIDESRVTAMKDAVIAELFVHIVNYFFDYAKYLLSLPEIRNEVIKIFKGYKVPENYIDNPEYVLYYYLDNTGFKEFNNEALQIKYLPRYLLPSNFRKGVLFFKKLIERKMKSLLNLEKFASNWQPFLFYDISRKLFI